MSQTVLNVDSLQSTDAEKAVAIRQLFNDSLSSSSLITVNTQVKPHFHRNHTEQVLILDGTGTMLLGDKRMNIRKGDLILISKGMVHAVTNTGDIPLKVLSIQSPFFDGIDRVWVKE